MNQDTTSSWRFPLACESWIAGAFCQSASHGRIDHGPWQRDTRCRIAFIRKMATFTGPRFQARFGMLPPSSTLLLTQRRAGLQPACQDGAEDRRRHRTEDRRVDAGGHAGGHDGHWRGPARLAGQPELMAIIEPSLQNMEDDL